MGKNRRKTEKRGSGPNWEEEGDGRRSLQGTVAGRSNAGNRP
ncbi:uncharacterized protein G2W53_003776 [Senna tora]|uniref:Uncharacterized protein n=1 Tax=Senna tora TaxID=362788 RepID=A0A834X9A3_9FABA|nr:uncharacterized protein G2W53_003776 [Senna tora]